MKKNKMRFYEKREHFAGYRETNEENRADGSMMVDGSHDFACMPQHPIVKAYPSGMGYVDPTLLKDSDNIIGIDMQMRKDGAKMREQRSKVKL